MGSKPEKPKEPEKTQKEIIREQRRNIDRSIRDLERELKKTDKDEAKMKKEIKGLVEKGQTVAAKGMAKDIVRLKNQSKKLNQFIGQLRGVSLRVASLGALSSLSEAMEETGKAIATVSKNLDSSKLQKLSKQLVMEDAKLEMKSEMMGEILDGMGEDTEEEQNEIYEQVLQEIGIKVSEQMPEANVKNQEEAKENNNQENEGNLDDLLNELKK